MRKLITYLAAALLLSSCGSLKKLNTEEIAIRKAIAVNDLYGLMDIHACSDEYRTFIEDYLSSVSFSQYSYQEIVDLERYSEQDSNLFSIFNDAKTTYEAIVIESLSDMSLDSLASYYIDNSEESVFIYPVLHDNLIKDLGSQDYRYIKAVHDAFIGSDLASDIDSVYLPLRKHLIIEVKDHLHEYFRYENATMRELHEAAWNNIQSSLSYNLPIIIDSTLNKVNRDIFDKLIKNEKYDQMTDREYIIELIDKYLPEENLKSRIIQPVEEFISTCNTSRTEFIETFINDGVLTDDLLIDIPNELVEQLEFSYNAIDKIEFTKALSTLYDIGSIALGFVTAGASELILDAADLAFGFWMENKKAKKITDSIQQLSNDLSANYNYAAQRIIYSYYKPLEESLSRTQNNLEKYVDENF